MKTAMYQVIQSKAGQSIKLRLSEPRDGFRRDPLRNDKYLTHSAEMSVDAAKALFPALAAEGYAMRKGENIIR